jgi:hypothetical protein
MESRLTVKKARRVVNIAFLAHKYEFHALRQWVLDLLQQETSPRVFQTCGSLELENFISATDKFGWVSIKNTLTNELIERIGRKGNNPLRSFARSLRFAEKLRDRDLQVRAYYTYLKTTKRRPGYDAINSEKEEGFGIQEIRATGLLQPLRKAGLSKQQVSQLCAGFTSLLSIRSRLRFLPSIKNCEDCKPETTMYGGAKQTCLQFWTNWWTSEEAKLRVDNTFDNQDPIQFLQVMQRRLTSVGSGNAYKSRNGWEPTGICAKNVAAQLVEMENTLKADLDKYFMLSDDSLGI